MEVDDFVIGYDGANWIDIESGDRRNKNLSRPPDGPLYHILFSFSKAI